MKASKVVILAPNVEEVKKNRFTDEKNQYGEEDVREKKYNSSK
jgi:hypothetical protein